jgi:hypothetical protein
MMSPILVLIYLGICLPVAIVGTGSRLGFLGTYLFSVLLTPLVMIFLLMTIMPKTRALPANKKKALQE